MNNNWIPEILYEEGEEGITSKIPFIGVPPEEEMPKILFIFESRDTGELEPGPDGEDLPVSEITLHQYADMEYLKLNLSPTAYDDVRMALGLEPLLDAVKKGQKITEGIRQSLGSTE